MSDPKPRFGSLWPVSANAMTVPDGCSAGVDGALWSGSFASLPIDRALSSRHDRPPGLARMNVAVAPQPGVTALGVGVLLPHAPVTIASSTAMTSAARRAGDAVLTRPTRPRHSRRCA